MDGHEDEDGQQGEQLGVDGEGSEGNIQGTKVRRYKLAQSSFPGLAISNAKI